MRQIVFFLQGVDDMGTKTFKLASLPVLSVTDFFGQSKSQHNRFGLCYKTESGLEILSFFISERALAGKIAVLASDNINELHIYALNDSAIESLEYQLRHLLIQRKFSLSSMPSGQGKIWTLRFLKK